MSRLKELAGAAAALSVAALALWILGFVRHFTPGITTWGYFDLEMYFYPKFIYGAQALVHGTIPLWNPYEFCGMPFLATAQVAALYPLKNLVFGLFPPALALHGNYLLHMVIAGLCAYAYARWLGASPAAAMISAVVWAFHRNFMTSAYHPMRIMTLAWVPLILLLFERALVRRTIGSAALAGAVVALDFTAGYPGYVLCTIALLGVDFLFQVWRVRREGAVVVLKMSGTAVAAGVFAFAFAAPQIFPLAELVADTSRGSLVERYVEHFESEGSTGGAAVAMLPLATAFNVALNTGPASPYAFGGVLFGEAAARWFCVAALLVIQAASGPALPLFRLLPGFSLVRAPFLIWGMLPGALSGPLAALGFDRLVGRDAPVKRTTVLLIALPLVMTLGAWLAFGSFWPAGPLAAVTGAVAIAAHGAPRLRAAAAGAVAIAFLVTVYIDLPYGKGARPYPTRRPDPAIREEIQAIAGGGRIYSPSIVLRGEQMIDRLPIISGYEASLRPIRVGRLIETAGLRENFIGRGPSWTKLAEHRQLLDLFGVTLVVTSEYRGQVRAAGLLPGPTLSDRRTTFLNPSALDRAYVVHRVRSVATAEEAYAALLDEGFRPREEAVVEGSLPQLEGAAQPSIPPLVTWVAEQPESVMLDARLSAEGLLVLSDAIFPGWEALVDDSPAPILATNYAFRGVALSAGKHRVTFRYRPRGFRVGVWFAGSAAAIALAAAGGRRLFRGARSRHVLESPEARPAA
jgi:hypothetical protein